ncbi:MAG: GNAT family N-acetyltransferase [Acidobacteria bacterium]|nr:GNAT family N-acetyltransferase [Acidobacteriota bacterium]
MQELNAPKLVSIRRVDHTQTIFIDGLAELLIDSVSNGASVGFLNPVTSSTAKAYWHHVFSTPEDELVLWVATCEETIVGSVQLALCPKENGRHRAEVQKLMVHSTARGHRIASRLMQTLETYALQNGRFLLVLDTEAGSPAESVYQHLNWQKAGEIPDYARNAAGQLHATAYYFKLLR